ncbi:MAG TPA: 4'-phosphopantetheinyl transferase superfamily protein, partial [Candidatus Binatia bacterium]|nr:4'-phosphopantetheinyl transferase superfamily protein [Candidatus Binatia bacterium]
MHEDDIGFFAKQLGASEARRYGAFRRRERKRQFLLGRMLLRFAVARLLSLPPDTLGIVERNNNAPELVLPASTRARPNFSLSHSGDWVACAISPDAILGVDIELNKPNRNVFAASQMAFHPKEFRWLLQQSPAPRLSAFYQLWCTKEALYKLMCALGRESVSSPLVDTDNLLASQGEGWCGYTWVHCSLTIALCSDQPLSALHKLELAGLSRADWLTLGGEFLEVHAGVNQQ